MSAVLEPIACGRRLWAEYTAIVVLIDFESLGPNVFALC